MSEHRKRLEKAIDDMANTSTCMDIFDRAIQAERERCAKIAETPLGPGLCDYDDHWGPRIAQAIRRGTT